MKKEELVMQLCTIQEALHDIAAGKMIIVIDNENRENEGDLIMAAEKITPEAINFMTKHGRGLICVSITKELAQKLHLAPMVQHNSAPFQTAFTISIDVKDGATTGISAFDRALTIQTLLRPDATYDMFVAPGHIFPLIAQDGGVLQREGHTEASVDLATLAGLHPSGVICEILHEDGSMARLPDLWLFAKKHNLNIVSIQDLVRYKRSLARVRHIEQIAMPTTYGQFQLHVFQDTLHHDIIMTLVKGELDDKPIMTRIHSSCMTGEIWCSERCDCDAQLRIAMQEIEKEGRGIIIYLQQEGRGIGFLNKIKAYQLQDKGYDTVEANGKLGFEADIREYTAAAHVLHYLKVKQVHLLTNNPRKIAGMVQNGISVVTRIPLEIKSNKSNETYLSAKKRKLGHMLSEF